MSIDRGIWPNRSLCNKRFSDTIHFANCMHANRIDTQRIMRRIGVKQKSQIQ